jgi:hypothetical protein
MFGISSLLLTVILLIAPAGASTPAVPDCTICADASDGPEHWVWGRVLSGEEADLSDYQNERRPLDHGSASRILRPAFLRALILSCEDHRVISTRGISIANAVVCDPAGPDQPTCQEKKPQSILARDDTDVRRCFPDNCAAALDLRDLRFRGGLVFRNVEFRSDVALGGAHFEQVLNLDESRFDGDVDAYRLRVDGGLTLYKVTVNGNFEGDGMHIGGTANFYRTHILGSIHLRNAHVENDIDFGRIVVDGPFPIVRPPEPRSSVELPRSAIDLSNSLIAGQLYATGAKVSNGHVDLSGVTVNGSIWMETDTPPGGNEVTTDLACGLTLERARVGNDLMLGGGRFSQIDLTSARIEGALRLESGGKGTIWTSPGEAQYLSCNQGITGKGRGQSKDYTYKSWLVLRNAQIYAIRDTRAGWPDCITLAGLVYTRPPQDLAATVYVSDPAAEFRSCDKTVMAVAPTSHSDETVAPRDSDWWLNWLSRDPQLTSQDYVTLAIALDLVGDHDQADEVRYSMRVFQIDKTQDFWQRWANQAAGRFVGFGIGSYTVRAFGWAVALLLVGVVLLWFRLHGLRTFHKDDKVVKADLSHKGFWWCVVATTQTILPLITLSKGIDDFLHAPLKKGQPTTAPLSGRAAIAFAAIALFGLILSGFLLQALRTSFGL